MNHDIEQAIKYHADTANLPIQLVRAIVLVESNGNPWAIRHEPRYRYLWDVGSNTPFRKIQQDELLDATAAQGLDAIPGSSRDTEWMGQRTSWGLMQVMGAVAREYGFRGWFPQLCDINTGLQYGCKHLSVLVQRYKAKHTWRGVVAAYNTGQPAHTAGPGLDYLTKVSNKGGLDFL